ncbi:MAG: hypothetical protein KIT44_07435 [Opitutaceae bacterium]|nr:hypothetical protein [Opitutaceae bacterium]
MKIPNFLNRYTTLPFLLDLLKTGRLELRRPESWEDENDAHYLERYQEVKKLKTLRALCFTAGRERFHHWKCFADGSGGVCIEFRRSALISTIRHDGRFRFGSVQYERIDRVATTRPPVDKWPFLKRLPFEDEKEFRVIFEESSSDDADAVIDVEKAAIRKVTLSPWLPKNVEKSVKEVIRSMEGCEELDVSRSSLLQSAKWRKAIAH